jgi:hypothetical protein
MEPKIRRLTQIYGNYNTIQMVSALESISVAKLLKHIVRKLSSVKTDLIDLTYLDPQYLYIDKDSPLLIVSLTPITKYSKYYGLLKEDNIKLILAPEVKIDNNISNYHHIEIDRDLYGIAVVETLMFAILFSYYLSIL